MVHACAQKYVKKPEQLISYVKCMMSDNYDPLAIGKSVSIYPNSCPLPFSHFGHYFSKCSLRTQPGLAFELGTKSGFAVCRPQLLFY